jgi:hypothetical protein
MFRTACTTLLALVLITGAASAQITSKAARAGGWMLSGQAGFRYYLPSSDGEFDTQTSGLSLNLAPRLLFFLADGLGAGGELGLGYSSSKAGAYEMKSTSLAIGPRLAYYLRNATRHYPRACCLAPLIDPDGWWLPFGGITLQYLSDLYDYGTVEQTWSGFRARAGVGVSPLIGTHGTMPVELGFQYQTLSADVGEVTQTQKSSTIYLEVGFGAFLFRQPER